MLWHARASRWHVGGAPAAVCTFVQAARNLLLHRPTPLSTGATGCPCGAPCTIATHCSFTPARPASARRALSSPDTQLLGLTMHQGGGAQQSSLSGFQPGLHFAGGLRQTQAQPDALPLMSRLGAFCAHRPSAPAALR